MIMRIEFQKDPRSGIIMAVHTSNGAIIGNGWNRHLALANVIESVGKAVDDLDPDLGLTTAEEEALDHLRRAVSLLRAEGDAIEEENCPDSENIYNTPSIRQSIEEDRK